MNQSSCCCGDFEFMDAAYCYYDPNRRCVKTIAELARIQFRC